MYEYIDTMYEYIDTMYEYIDTMYSLFPCIMRKILLISCPEIWGAHYAWVHLKGFFPPSTCHF